MGFPAGGWEQEKKKKKGEGAASGIGFPPYQGGTKEGKSKIGIAQL